MSVLDELGTVVSGLAENPIATGVTGLAAGAVLGAGLTAAVTSSGSKSSSRSSNRKSGRKIKHTKRGWKQDRARFNKRQKWEVAYRKRKARLARMKHSGKSHRRSGKLHYTKNGQPYIILNSGKARFVKRKK